MRRWPAIALIGLSLIGLSVASTAYAQQTLIDDRGAAIHLSDVPRRIVSLLPSLTESVCALGSCERLVGTDRFSNWPASVGKLPKLGGLDDAQIESIVALKPDVVLVSNSARVTDRLESLGLKVVVMESRNRADVERTLILLGKMLHAEDAADRVWKRIEQETRDAALRVPSSIRGKRVYFEVDATPYAAGASSFVGETLLALGMSNAIAPELGAFPKLNPEYIVRVQPDIIMATARDLQTMSGRPGWSSLKALQQRQTCGFAPGRYDLLVRPGPRMGEAAGVLADCLTAISKDR
jgi:iron complex transport system substrate-binding protein